MLVLLVVWRFAAPTNDHGYVCVDTSLLNPKNPILPRQILRTAQYGCNCRGMGGNGGCGEFDVLEAVVGNQYSDMLFTQVPCMSRLKVSVDRRDCKLIAGTYE